MDKSTKLLIKIASAAFGVLILAGIWLFLISDTFWSGKFIEGLRIKRVDSGWTYTTNLSDQPVEVELPVKLNLEEGVQHIKLVGTIPNEPINGGMIRYGSFIQVVRIYINGELRVQYGDMSANSYYYPYLTAAHYLMTDLKQEDYGGEIIITLEAPPKYAAEFSQIQYLEMGSRRDFLVRTLIKDASSIISTVITFLFGLILLGIALVTWKRNIPSRLLFLFAIYALLWVGYYSTDNALLWELTNYSPRYSAFNDWRYYILDAFLPVFSFYILLSCLPVKLKKWQKALINGHALFFIFAAACMILQAVSISFFCVALKHMAIVIYVMLFIKIRKQIRSAERKYFIISIFVVLFCFFIDYIRYNISLRPLFADIYELIQLKIPFLFALGMGLYIYCILTLVGVVDLFNAEKLSYQRVADSISQQLKFNQHQYDEMMNRVQSLKAHRHDMQYHLRTIYTFMKERNYEDTEQYLTRLLDDIDRYSLAQWCESPVCSSILGWYHAEAERKNIRFKCSAVIPREKQEVSIDLSALLSNSLQNALEACSKPEVKDPEILFSAKPSGKSLHIRVENSYNGQLVKDQGKILSSKEEEGHGIGIESIRAVVNKYEGMLQIDTSEKKFTMDVILNDIY